MLEDAALFRQSVPFYIEDRLGVCYWGILHASGQFIYFS